MSNWIYRADQDTPSYPVTWNEWDYTVAPPVRQPIDFSNVGYTFEVKLINRADGTTVALTKTAGITGAATSPNITIAWSAGELNIAAAAYKLHLTATLSGADRMFRPGDEPVITIVAAL